MKSCESCGMKFSDAEPFCPLCGPDSTVRTIPGTYTRVSYPESPKTIGRIQTQPVFDRSVFIILTVISALLIGGLLAIDLIADGSIGWSRYTTAILLAFWAIIVFPYAFSRFYGHHYILLFAVSLSGLLLYFDHMDGLLGWSVIVTCILTIPAAVNWVIFSVKGS